MAGEIIAAFRTVMLFITLSWLSVMYLLMYRVPQIDENSSRGRYQMIKNSMILDNYRMKSSVASSVIKDGEIQIFGEDSADMKLDLRNPRNGAFRFASDRIKKQVNPNIPLLDSDKGFEIRKSNKRNAILSDSFDCRLLERMRTFEVLGTGYTKVVRRGVINGQSFALKYTTNHNHDVIKCKSERPIERHFECINLAKFKLLKEALLFSQLRHKNIIKVNKPQMLLGLICVAIREWVDFFSISIF